MVTKYDPLFRVVNFSESHTKGMSSFSFNKEVFKHSQYRNTKSPSIVQDVNLITWSHLKSSNV